MSYNITKHLNQVGALKLMASAVFVFLFVLMLFPQSLEAGRNPFSRVAGSWRSSGAKVSGLAGAERIKCRVYYGVKSKSTSLSIKCSGSNYFINVSGYIKHKGSSLSGSWSEKSFGKSGWLSGSAKGKSASISFGGGGFGGHLSISMKSSKRHYIYISSSNGVNASIPLRR